VTVAAVFLSNVPEGLQRWHEKASRSAGYIFSVWVGIASGVCGGHQAMPLVLVCGNYRCDYCCGSRCHSGNDNDTMIPEAFGAHNLLA